MDKHYDPGRYEVSLIQGHGQKQQTLEKMRRKLAAASGVSPSASHAAPRTAVRRGAARRNSILRWATLVAMSVSVVAAMLAGNWGIQALRETAPAPLRKKHVPRVDKAPAYLTPDQQALYWTYALYDFDKLRKSFRVPGGAVVNNARARENLLALLPKVDPRTRVIVEGYLPKPRSKP